MGRNFRFSDAIFRFFSSDSRNQETGGDSKKKLRRFSLDGCTGGNGSGLSRRRLQLETLEERRLLSVTTAEYEAFRTDYAEFDLPASMDDLNVIEVTATGGSLSHADLAAAIATAGSTAQSDLIVVRTSETAHSVVYSKAADEIILNIDPASFGSITIVALGDAPLTLDAATQSRVMTVATGTVNLGNLILTGGSASGYGGGLYNSGQTTLADCVISDNIVNGYYSSGGGVCNTSTGNLTIVDSLVSGNSVTGSYATLGGGVSNEYGVLTLTGCEVVDNIVNGPQNNLGGGVCNNYGTLTLTDCVIHGNSVTIDSFYSLGGGVCNGGNAVMTNCLVYANSAMHGGGVGSQKIMTLTNCSITGNTATNGGGFWAYGVSDEQYIVELNNVILVGNTATNAADLLRYNRYIILNAHNTLSTYSAWNNAADAVNYAYDATAPLFTDTANNDYTLAVDSQAIDRGNSDYVTVTADLAGNPRISGKSVDLGAYEFQTTTEPLSAPQNVAAVSGGANRISVTWNAVTNASGYEIAWSADQTVWTVVTTHETSSLVTGLTYGASYAFKVKALGDGTSWSDSDDSATVSAIVCPMDIDGDGWIGPADWTLLSSTWLTTSASEEWDGRCDIDGDGQVGQTDLNYFSSNWLQSATSADLNFPAALEATSDVTVTESAAELQTETPDAVLTVTAAETTAVPEETADVGFTPLPSSSVLDTASTVVFSTAAVTDLDVMNLNSNTETAYSIYLDFDGHTTSGTQWNEIYTDGADIVTSRFNLDGDSTKTEFSEIEKAAIYEIWLRVAEDFMPFNVNVTTVEPEAEAFTSAHAVRIIIGGSYADWYGSPAGGVSYIGDFIWQSDTPSFIFSDNLSGNIKFIAETTSHEAGHTLGLAHDGSYLAENQTEYYEGANGWAPIMGAGYYEELTQWSKGEYVGATNTEDDLDIITYRNGFDYRTDDDSNSFETARTLTITDGTGLLSGIIERNTDVDYFVFTTDGSALDFRVGGIKGVTNLDVLVKIYNADQALVATYNPTETTYAEFVFTEAAGTYYLTVEGTGKETTTAGIYSDYGSLGAYDVTVGYAAVLTVTTLDDTVATDGFLSLREAVLAASERTTIVFDASLTGGTITLANGVITLDKAVAIDGSSIGGITINGNGSRIFIVTSSAVLTNLTLTGGGGITKGAAIYNDGTLTVINSVLTANTATQRGEYLVGGGALYNDSDATAVIIGSTLSGNKGNFGGAVYNIGTLTLTETTFENNASWSYHGGAVYNTGSITITDCVFTDNTSINHTGYTVGGGAIYNAASAVVTESGSTFSRNKGTLGGAFFNAGTMTISGTTLSDNASWSNKGGAIFNSGSLTVTNAVFSDNTAAADGQHVVGGGALYITATGDCAVTQSVFYGNRGDLGGAIFNMGNTTLTNVTVTQNTANNSYGGGLFNNGGTLTVNNSIVAENISAVDLPDVCPYAGNVNGSNNLSSFTGWGEGTGNLTYSSDAPLFTDAANHDFTLVAGSQAVNVGNNDFVTTETDLAGHPRIINLIVDMGAYEYQAVLTPLSTPDGVKLSSAGSNRISVVWNAVDEATGYELAYSVNQTEWTTATSLMTSFVVTGQTYGTQVFIKIKAIGDGTVHSDSDDSVPQAIYVCPMDIDSDGRIGPSDRTILSISWMTGSGSANWDPRADIDGDNRVGPTDRNYLSSNWMKSVTSTTLAYPPARADLVLAGPLSLESEEDGNFENFDAGVQESARDEVFTDGIEDLLAQTL